MADDERLVQATKDLTNQVARVAYALEALFCGYLMVHLSNDQKFEKPCTTCGCRLIPTGKHVCPACGE